MLNLGYMFEHGLGVQTDYGVAMSWFRRAADRGLADAMCQVGGLYVSGHGVDRDLTKARSWFQRCEQAGGKHAREWLDSLPAQ
jgi:hypothetical protein